MKKIALFLALFLVNTAIANTPPIAELIEPSNGSDGLPINVTLGVRIYDAENDTINVTFYGSDERLGEFKNVSSGSTLMLIWRNLSYSTTYFWYVTMDDGFNESRSETWNFTTMEKPPSCSIFAQPSSGYAPLNVTFRISMEGEGAAWQIDVDGDRLAEYYGSGSPPSSIYHVYSQPGYYLVRLTVREANGNAVYSTCNVAVFSPPPNHPPSMPSSPYPENGSVSLPLAINLSWNCSDADNDSITYDVYFGKSFPLPKIAENITSKHLKVDGLNLSTIYYWKVVAWDEHGTKNSSQIWHFRTRLPHPYRIDIRIIPENSGYVEPFINESYEGEKVCLHAVAKDGYEFSHWGGDVNGKNEVVTFRVDGNKTILAYFKKIMPWVIFEMPENGSIVGGIIEINGKAGNIIKKVDVRIDKGRWFQAYGKEEWRCYIDTTHLSNGIHVVEAVAYDGMEYGNASSIYIKVFNNHKPWVRITKPSGNVVKGKIKVEGIAGDKDGDNVSIVVRVNGETIHAYGEVWRCYIDTTHLSNGIHVVEAVAYDGMEYGKPDKCIIWVENEKSTPGFEIVLFIMAILIAMRRIK